MLCSSRRIPSRHKVVYCCRQDYLLIIGGKASRAFPVTLQHGTLDCVNNYTLVHTYFLDVSGPHRH